MSCADLAKSPRRREEEALHFSDGLKTSVRLREVFRGKVQFVSTYFCEGQDWAARSVPDNRALLRIRALTERTVFQKPSGATWMLTAPIFGYKTFSPFL